MKKYEATTYGIPEYISEVEVTHETEKSVWVDGSRTSKKTRHIFDTWEDAKSFLVEFAEAKLIRAHKQVERASFVRSTVLELKRPD